MVNSNSQYSARLTCIECGSEFPLQSVLYRCTKCQGLLNVAHDVSALKERSPEEWKALFDARAARRQSPFDSGVWFFKEWVLPEIETEHITTLGEGNSPLTTLPRLAQELGLSSVGIKQCGVSHTGSFKDLGMTVLVSHVNSLRARGLPIRAVACASTGDTSAALAAYAAAAGVPTVVFLPEGKITDAQLLQPLACGALVLALETDFDGCMEVVKAVTQDDSIYLANSMNPLRLEGQKTISFELARNGDWELPDWVIIPGGNLGNVSALGEGFRLLKDLGLIQKIPRICLAQSARANPMYLSYQTGYDSYAAITAGATQASAIRIGNPVSYPRAVRVLKEFGGVVEQADEFALSEAAARVDQHGMFNCPHTGVALAALFQLREAGTIEAGQSAVVISTAHGLKFSAFKEGYHAGTLDGVDAVRARFRNQFHSLPPDASRVQSFLEERIGEHTAR